MFTAANELAQLDKCLGFGNSPKLPSFFFLQKERVSCFASDNIQEKNRLLRLGKKSAFLHMKQCEINRYRHWICFMWPWKLPVVPPHGTLMGLLSGMDMPLSHASKLLCEIYTITRLCCSCCCCCCWLLLLLLLGDVTDVECLHNSCCPQELVPYCSQEAECNSTMRGLAKNMWSTGMESQKSTVSWKHWGSQFWSILQDFKIFPHSFDGSFF